MPSEASIRSLFEDQRDKPPTRWQTVFISIYLLIGLAGLSATIFYWVYEERFPLHFLLVGLPYTALGVYFTADLHNERACARRMLTALDANGAGLAWVYIESISGMYAATLFHYHFTDRRHGSLPVTRALADELLAWFGRCHADLSTGYTSDLEKRWRRAPAALKTSPQRSFVVKQTISSDNPSNGW